MMFGAVMSFTHTDEVFPPSGAEAAAAPVSPTGVSTSACSM